MSGWSDGYVSGIDYTTNFTKEMSPTRLGFTGLVLGQCVPDFARPFRCVELGSGQGFTANMLATTHPQATALATDFNPAHTVNARALATDAGSDNIRFLDLSFAELLEQPGLEELDLITLHGVWTWVDAANRGLIREFIRRRLRPGGLVYVSYNALPGWAPILPLRKLMVELAAGASGGIEQRIDYAIGFVERFLAQQPEYATINGGVQERFTKTIHQENRHYLAHEYFNKEWTPFHHSDVVADLAEAKLSYIGSATLLDHVDSLHLSAEQLAQLDELSDPALRESARDWFVNRVFRRDIFVRGALPLRPAEQPARWLRQRFALTTARAQVPQAIAGNRQELALQPEIFSPLLDALAEAPMSLAELLDRPPLGSIGFGKLKEALSLLFAMDHVAPCPAAPVPPERIAAFNAAVLHRARIGPTLPALASGVTGNGVKLDRVDQLAALAQRAGQPDPAAFVWRMIRDGQPTPVAADDPLAELHADMQARVGSFEAERLPLLRQLGVL